MNMRGLVMATYDHSSGRESPVYKDSHIESLYTGFAPHDIVCGLSPMKSPFESQVPSITT